MSADNWAICPRCIHDAEAQLDTEEENLKTSYGKVDSEVWLRSAESFRKKKEDFHSRESLQHTFREYYEIGVDEAGVFAVN